MKDIKTRFTSTQTFQVKTWTCPGLDLYAYQVREVREDFNSRGERVQRQVKTSEGFTTQEELDKFSKGEARKLAEALLPQGMMPLALSPKDLSIYQTDLSREGFLKAHKPYTNLSKGQASLYGWRCDMALTLEGQIVPRVMNFNYINGGFSNQFYKLKRAVKVLKANPRVKMLPNGGEEWGDGSDIGRIPGYNSHLGHTHMIAFEWTPTQDEMDRIHHYLKERPSLDCWNSPPLEECSMRHYQSAAIALDILGLAVARKRTKKS